MRILRTVVLSIGLMGLAVGCGGSTKEESTTEAVTDPCAGGEEMADPCGGDVCGGDEWEDPCGGDVCGGDDMGDPCGGDDMEDPCGGGW